MKLNDMPDVPYVYPNTYEEQRKNRLDDCVADYLNDQDVSPSDFFYDLLDVVTEWEKYHEEYMQKAQSVKSLICGRQQPTSRKHSRLDALD